MASYDVLKEIVSNGSDLTILHGVKREWLVELAAIASTSGAKLTLSTAMDSEVISELSRLYGKGIAFVDGLSSYKKD